MRAPKEYIKELILGASKLVLRSLALRQIDYLKKESVTIVTVNWNSLKYLKVLIELVKQRSPIKTGIIVVDNGSRDGSREFLRHCRDVRSIFLPFNAGHPAALDIGFLCARTEYVVALDVDAFPLHDKWLDRLLSPLRNGYTISGARLNREYVHPCCLAMRLERFIRRRHTFWSDYVSTNDVGSNDVGEYLSKTDGGPLYFFDPTSQRGPGDVGTVFGDLVYHNFYSMRFLGRAGTILDHVVSSSDPVLAWGEALERWGSRRPSQ